MKRKDVIVKLIEYDIKQIIQDHPERFIVEVLENGLKGYNEMLDCTIEESYNKIFSDIMGGEPITIEE